jgi:hypothetical protein
MNPLSRIDGADLSKDRPGTGHIPVFAELSIAKPEYVDDIIFHFVIF